MSLMSIADARDPRSLASKLRRKRFELFKALLNEVPRPFDILDVGGTEAFWRDSELLDDHGISVTLLNVAFPTQNSPRVRQMWGDARALQFNDKHFDVVYSNSVIEHVGGRAEQRRMAREIRRVGKRHFVQTPNYYFPLEPHFLVPGFQFLPVAARARLLHAFDLGWLKREPDLASARDVVDSVKLLKRREFAAFFPTSTIYDERYLGLTKSFIAYGGFSSPS